MTIQTPTLFKKDSRSFMDKYEKLILFSLWGVGLAVFVLFCFLVVSPSPYSLILGG